VVQKTRAEKQDHFKLQFEIKAARSRHANAIRGLHFDVANYRLMKRGEEPRAKIVFERLHGLRDNTKEMAARPRFDQLKEKNLKSKSGQYRRKNAFADFGKSEDAGRLKALIWITELLPICWTDFGVI